MKSLAHPGWPYIGTPHEWRGFRDKVERKLTKEESAKIWEALWKSCAVYQKQNFGPDLD